MIRFLYKKWIRRRCPHICACCEFRKDHYTECFEEMEQKRSRALEVIEKMKRRARSHERE